MKIERKYMAHYLNTVFAGDTGTAAYVRLGKDLEEYSPELSANVEKKSNIMGETSVTIDSYQKQGEVAPYYAEKDDPLFTKLQAIIDGDLVLDDLKTDIVEVKLWNATLKSAATAATPPATRSRSMSTTRALKRPVPSTSAQRPLQHRPDESMTMSAFANEQGRFCDALIGQ